MKKNNWFGIICKVILKKHNPPKDAENNAIAFFSGLCEDKRYYIKLTPCKNNILYPEIGIMTQKEFVEFDKKRFMYQTEAMRKILEDYYKDNNIEPPIGLSETPKDKLN